MDGRRRCHPSRQRHRAVHIPQQLQARLCTCTSMQTTKRPRRAPPLLEPVQGQRWMARSQAMGASTRVGQPHVHLEPMAHNKSQHAIQNARRNNPSRRWDRRAASHPIQLPDGVPCRRTKALPQGPQLGRRPPDRRIVSQQNTSMQRRASSPCESHPKTKDPCPNRCRNWAADDHVR